MRGGAPTREERRGGGTGGRRGATDGMGKDGRGQFCWRGGGVRVGLSEGGVKP